MAILEDIMTENLGMGQLERGLKAEKDRLGRESDEETNTGRNSSSIDRQVSHRQERHRTQNSRRDI